MEAPETGSCVKEDEQWIELTETKQFSRLLYTNPVCFLSTTAARVESSGGVCRNVMVLTWLSATSNDGTFMCSIHKTRFTATLLQTGAEFVLSVPVEGMEPLIRDVGSISGRWGSKFPRDHKGENPIQKSLPDEKNLSKRQAKKRSRMLLSSSGVPGLEAVPFGLQAPLEEDSSELFVIQGTVAQMKCAIYKLMDGEIDEDHLLILARITAAHVHPKYWDANKNILRAEATAPPYLTFFGSQEFGYVVTDLPS